MKPNKIELDQQTQREQWLSWRRCHLTATDSAKILGLSKWGTAKDVYDDKLGLSAEKPMNFAMAEGVRNEPIARDLLSRQEDKEFEPAVFESGEYPFMGASLDAITKDGEHGGEIKCVGEKTFDRALNDDVDESYIVQCQKQMYVADLEEWILFFMLVSGENKGATVRVSLKRDDKFIAKMIKAENDFWFNNIIPKIPPALTNKDWDIRDNSFENQLASKWLELKADRDQADKHLKEIEKQLKELANGNSVHYVGAGVKVQQINRKGVVNWDQVCNKWKISKEEIESFRKENSSYVKITSEA